MSRVVEAARRWVGTPYLHQASRRGSGCDCLGLVLGVWREIGTARPVTVPPYAADWAENGDADQLFEAARRVLDYAETGELTAGRIILMRMRARGPAKHMGIVTEAGARPLFVHSYWGRGVVESALSAPWRRQIVAQFDFPKGAE